MDLPNVLLGLSLLALPGFRVAMPAPYCEHFRTANYYGDHMVLQKGSGSAIIWGYIGEVGVDVNVYFDGGIYQDISLMGPEGEPIWRVELDPMEGGMTAYTINITTDACDSIQLSNVVFGDVFVCAGQGNMHFEMNKVDDPEDDISDSPNYPYLRTLQVRPLYSNSVQYEVGGIDQAWEVPTSDNIATFSAICWLFGVRMFNMWQIPIGLIQSTYGGTRIEAWSSPDTLRMCFPKGASPGYNSNQESVIYNAMIHPFFRMPIYSTLWYQGEANIMNPQIYICNLPTMVDDWRNKWRDGTNDNTDMMIPFGIVQLAPFTRNGTIMRFPEIRWAQSGRQGYVPDDILHHCYFSAAHDLPDFDVDPIHPRYKRQIADRLALGLHFLVGHKHPRGYDEEHERHMGPLPKAFTRVGERLEIDYGEEVQLIYRDTVNSVHFDICCSEDPSTSCKKGGEWINVPDIVVQGPQSLELDIPCLEGNVIVGIRYAWRESPCELEECAIYDDFNVDGIALSLPHAPFTFETYINKKLRIN